MLSLCLAVVTLAAQDITGKWSGTLKATGPNGENIELRVNFNISATENGYTSTLDSPDQDAYGIAVDTTIFLKPELTVKVAQLYLEYTGKLVDAENIEGTLTQVGQAHELNLVKKE